MTTRPATTLDIALAYARHGWRVFPVHGIGEDGHCTCGSVIDEDGNPHRDIGKHPKIKRWQVEASREEPDVKQWAKLFRHSNIGIATGAGSGIVVIDIDPAHGGEEGFRALRQDHGELAATLEVVTGSGGRHLYFRHPGPPCLNKQGLAQGVDIRGDGGYVVAPPSRHKSGGEYEWRDIDWETAIIATLPPNWVKLLSAKAPSPSRDFMDEEVTITAGNRNGYLIRIAGGLRHKGLGRDAIYAALLATNEHHCRPPLSDAEVAGLADSAMRWESEGLTVSIAKGLPKERDRIYQTIDRRDMLLSSVRFLHQHQPPIIFQRGGVLVHIKRDAAPIRGEYKRAASGSTIAMMSGDAILNALAEADWIKIKDGEEVGSAPPEYLGRAIMALPAWPFEPLHGITAWPILHRDGTVHTERGYDKSTGWFYEPMDSRELIPPKGFEQAVEIVRDVFADFPFQSNDDWAAFFAGLVSPLLRHLFSGNCPMITITAPKAGTGKTLLVDAAATLLTGHEATKRTCTRNEEEERKALFSINLSGDPIVLLDNVDHAIVSGLLASMLTAGKQKQRVLGMQDEAEALVTGTWFMTGNNLEIGGDNIRRVLRVSLDSGQERPEIRQGFKHPQLLNWISQERPVLLGALMYIASFYFRSGAPPLPRHLETFGSFENWSDLVRAMTFFVTGHDPVTTRAEFTEGDTERDAILTFFEAWWELYGDTPKTAIDAIDDADLMEKDKAATAFRDAACQWCNIPKRNGPEARKLGNKLARIKNSPIGPFTMRHNGKGRNGAQWTLKRCI